MYKEGYGSSGYVFFLPIYITGKKKETTNAKYSSVPPQKYAVITEQQEQMRKQEQE